MTGESAPDLLAGPSTQLPVPVIVGLCDRLLGEIGRRRHLFAWLRPPGSGTGDWLVVDAYYPGNRLVVVCREEDSEHDHLYAELVPSHGLRLLRLVPADLGGQQASAELALTRLIAELGPAPAPASAPALPKNRAKREGTGRDGAIARVAASLAQAAAPPSVQPRRIGRSQAAAAERAARFVQARKLAAGTSNLPGTPRSDPRAVKRNGTGARPSNGLAVTRGASRPRRSDRAPVAPARPAARRRGPPAAARTETFGIVVALALAALLCAELYVGIGRIALDGGHWVLGFGIALDACSRALGTIAAGGVGRRDWAWACALGGSPAVATFALLQPAGPVSTDPAPLAGLLSVLAGLVVAIALLAAALHL